MNICKEMRIFEVITNYPDAIEVFQKYGMGCLKCAASRLDTIEQGANAHGIDVNSFIIDLNDVAQGKRK